MSKTVILATSLLIALSISCFAQKNTDTAIKPTGRIEVHARSCDDPPYDKGLSLTLNSMSFLENDSLYDWVIPYVQKDELPMEEFLQIRDSLGNIAYDVVSWQKRNHNGKIAFRGIIVEYNEFKIAEGVTDSMGYYSFEDVPVGLYQVRCGYSPPIILPKEKEPIDSETNYEEIDWDTMPFVHIQDYSELLPRSVCRCGVTNFIRVAADSTSIVQVYMYQEYIGEGPNGVPFYWEEKFKDNRR